MYTHAYIHVCIYVCDYVSMCSVVYVCVMYMYMCVCVCVYVLVCLCMCMSMYMCVYVYMSMCVCISVCVRACLICFNCVLLCNVMACSPPGSSVHGILQARILEWVAMPSSRESSRSSDQTHVSYVSCIGRWVLYH